MSAARSLRIERMTLQMPGTGRDDARRVALLVAQALEQAAPGLGEATPPHSARITVEGRAGEPPESLAERIAGQIVTSLARSG